MRFHSILIITIAICNSGCSFFIAPENNPVLIEKVNDRTSVVSTTTSRRIVLISPGVQGNNGDKGTTIYCAEPSPDTVENIFSEDFLNAYLKAGNKGISGDTAITLERTFEQMARALGRRTQGMQLFRDGMYNLCQAYMNKAITSEQYNKLMEKLIVECCGLIKTEVNTEGWQSRYIEPPKEDKKYLGDIKRTADQKLSESKQSTAED